MAVLTLPPPPVANNTDAYVWKEWFRLLWVFLTVTPSSTLAAHIAASDPHTGYQKESEKNAANGYAGLDSVALVNTAQLGTGVANSTVFLRGDRTWAAASGGGALLSGTVTITPTVGRGVYEWTETVTATGIVPANKIMLSVSDHTDTDENSAEMLNISSMEGLAGTNQITVTVSFTDATAGAIKLNYIGI